MGVLIEFPMPQEPSPEEEELMHAALEHYERQADRLRRALGLTAIEGREHE